MVWATLAPSAYTLTRDSAPRAAGTVKVALAWLFLPVATTVQAPHEAGLPTAFHWLGGLIEDGTPPDLPSLLTAWTV